MPTDSSIAPARRRAALVYSPSRIGGDAVRATVARLIAEHGLAAGEYQLQAHDQHGSLSESASAELSETDLLVVLGGDGTLIQAARLLGSHRIPLLGVNSGRVGFMAQFEPEAFESQAEHLLGAGVIEVMGYNRIRGELFEPDSRSPSFVASALNEFVVTAGPPFRMITLQVVIDGRPGPRVSGDGLIVSTPIGSTAYNVSAGGPILEPRVNGVVITPIAAHSLSFRPIVVSAESTIEIVVLDANHTEGGGTTLVVDGQVRRSMDTDARLVLRPDPEPVGFVQNPSGTYWQTLIEKMHWAAPPRVRG